MAQETVDRNDFVAIDGHYALHALQLLKGWGDDPTQGGAIAESDCEPYYAFWRGHYYCPQGGVMLLE